MPRAPVIQAAVVYWQPQPPLDPWSLPQQVGFLLGSQHCASASASQQSTAAADSHGSARLAA